jgi:hypothetical protein
LGTADIVKFKHDDSDSLITLILSTTVFGWSVGDLYIAPDHARYILQTDHHEGHLRFLSHARRNRTLGLVMPGRGFALPEKVPDETFAPDLDEAMIAKIQIFGAARKAREAGPAQP